MKRFSIFCLSFALAACAPSQHCASIELQTPEESLPLVEYSPDSQGGIFDKAFAPSLWRGPQEFRCCFGAAKGVQLASCPAQPSCEGFDDARIMSVGKPFSGDEYQGASFCQVAVRDGAVVSVWGKYVD